MQPGKRPKRRVKPRVLKEHAWKGTLEAQGGTARRTERTGNGERLKGNVRKSFVKQKAAQRWIGQSPLLAWSWEAARLAFLALPQETVPFMEAKPFGMRWSTLAQVFIFFLF